MRVSGAHEYLALQAGCGPAGLPPTVNDIVREKRGITPEMAIRLAKYFGNSEQFWLNLQDALCGVSRQEEILQGTQRH